MINSYDKKHGQELERESPTRDALGSLPRVRSRKCAVGWSSDNLK